MIRIAGRNIISKKKQLAFALTPIKGIGKSNVKKLLENLYQESVKAKLLDIKLKEFLVLDLDALPGEVIVMLRNKVESDFLVEEELRRSTTLNINRHKDLKTWRGERHKLNLPTRGQKTRRNSRTVRGNAKNKGPSGKIKAKK
jgi:small subunit ribosomal protein S13